MLKVTNGDLFVCKEPMQRLRERDDIPVKYGIEIARLGRKLNELIFPIEQTRDGLVRKYGKQEGQNFSIKPEDENFEKFMKEFVELMNMDAGEVVLPKAKIPSNINIPTKDLEALEPFIEVVEIKE